MIARKLPKAIGFDLGETLVHYAGLPLNWQSLYPQALARVADVCGHRVTRAGIIAGQQVLAAYNTRLHPRQDEVGADRILGEVLAAWGLPSPLDLSPIEDAFFGFFQQRYAVYPETVSTLKGLQRLDMKIGVLTDVPYGMAKRFVAQDLAPLGSLVDVVLTSAEVGHRNPALDSTMVSGGTEAV